MVADRPLHAQSLHVDVTARYPLAQKCLHHSIAESSATIDGFACDEAVKDKARRYPDQHGFHCTTAAIETFGRVGSTFLDLLEELASAAAQRDTNRGLPPMSWRNRWLTRLSCGVQRFVASNVLDAVASYMSGAGGRP